jgi:hypothetical protein
MSAADGGPGASTDGGSSDGTTSSSDGSVQVGRSHDLGNCTMFPSADGSRTNYSYWNQDISSAQVDALSSQYIASLGSGKVHPDFGSDPSYGIPFDTVPSGQARVAMSFDDPGESEPGPYPFPPDAPIESGSDRHVLVVDRDACMLYETDASVYDSGGNAWSAFSGAVFDLKSGALRPETWTSADASGGPILIGLARYEEVAAGRIDHALRFTASRTQQAYIHPATHEAGSTSSAGVPPMGLRVRLQASMCPSLLAGAGSSHPEAKVIVQALCTYGMILADNGSNFYISGTTDPRWDDDDLSFLKTIPGNDFEAIDTGPLVAN